MKKRIGFVLTAAILSMGAVKAQDGEDNWPTHVRIWQAPGSPVDVYGNNLKIDSFGLGSCVSVTEGTRKLAVACGSFMVVPD